MPFSCPDRTLSSCSCCISQPLAARETRQPPSSRTRCPDWGYFLNRQYSRFQNRNEDSSESGEGSADQPKAVGRTLTSQEHTGCRSASPVYFPRTRPFFLFRYRDSSFFQPLGHLLCPRPCASHRHGVPSNHLSSGGFARQAGDVSNTDQGRNYAESRTETVGDTQTPLPSSRESGRLPGLLTCQLTPEGHLRVWKCPNAW